MLTRITFFVMGTRVQLSLGLPNFRFINGAKYTTPEHKPRGTRRTIKLKWNETMSINSATILATAVAFGHEHFQDRLSQSIIQATGHFC